MLLTCNDCCVQPGNLQVDVTGCGTGVPAGTSITVTGPETRTQTSGTFTGLAAGSYSVAVSRWGYVTSTTSATVTAGTTTTHAVTLTVATGYVCCPTRNSLVPTTIFLTTPRGDTITLTWNGATWKGCTGFSSNKASTLVGGVCTPNQTASTAAEYVISCGGSPNLRENYISGRDSSGFLAGIASGVVCTSGALDSTGAVCGLGSGGSLGNITITESGGAGTISAGLGQITTGTYTWTP